MSETRKAFCGYGDGARRVFTECAAWHGDEMFYNGKPIWRCSAHELTVLVMKQRDAYDEMGKAYDEAKRKKDEIFEEYRVSMRTSANELVEYARKLELELEELRKQKEEETK